MARIDAPGVAGFAYRLHKARNALSGDRGVRVTQGDLAGALHVKEAAYGHWETGRSLPDLHTVELLARQLDVSPAWLAFGLGPRRLRNDAPLGLQPSLEHAELPPRAASKESRSQGKQK